MRFSFLPATLLVVLLHAQPIISHGADVTTRPDKQSLTNASDNFVDALRANDVETLRGLFADDFVLIDHEGKTDTKESFVNAVKDGIITFRSVETGLIVKRLVGNAGLVHGLVELHLIYGRKAPADIKGKFAVSITFTYQTNQWRLSTMQMTSVKPKSP